MAMSNELQNLISRTANAARIWHGLSLDITDADVLLNGTPNWIAGLTQPEIDGIASFKAISLTVNDVAATLYILKLMNAVPSANDFPAFVKMANLR